MMPPGRIATLDAVRGFAVCGILIMNIVSMGEPGYAYVDPHYYGGAHGIDLAAWAIAYVLADGKMRALFAMLFGASLLLITDAAEDKDPGPARIHYARTFWLFMFGMLHAWFVWYGDILVEYAICGAVAFVARKWRPSALAFAAFCLIGFDMIHSLIQWHDMTVLRALANGPGAPADAVKAWNQVLAEATPGKAVIDQELRLYRGGIADAFAARAAMTALFQFSLMPVWVPGTLGWMGLGMLLFRIGFWTGDWPRRAYGIIIASGGVAILLYLPLVRAIMTRRFDPAFLPLADALTLLLRPFLSLAYASALILAIKGGVARGLIDRLAAAGRMAFSNYLGTSLIMTTIFYGYGFGLFGHLSRAQLYILVLLQWLLILCWSPWWLARFRYGPFEYLWRSLSRGRLLTLRQAIAS